MKVFPLPSESRKNASRSSAGELQRSLVAAMLKPAFYRGGAHEVTHKETHISHLFFAGNLVYKVKKPVRFSFLDFSTLARRRHFLHEELRLNARLAPSVYLGVLPISYENGGWRLGSDTHPVEYALVMRRLPERRMLDYLLDRDQVTPEMMQSLAAVLARFHAQAKTGGKINLSGTLETIRKLWDENLADIRPFVGRHLDADTLETIQDFGERFLARHEDLFVHRVHSGRIREVHGDLHCEHVCFAPEGVQIFDAIEFSREIRCCDLASEIAFLLMDLEMRGADELGRDFLRAYLTSMEDPNFLRVLPFYKCHRALVRGKVIALRSDGASALAPRYFQLARRYVWEEYKPFIVMMCGLTGSGKSTLARELNRRLGLPVLSSDAIRKELAGTAEQKPEASYGGGIYSPAMTAKTYAAIAERLEKYILMGEGAILDATFHRWFRREIILELARKYKLPIVLIHCRSKDEVIRERLRKRAEEGKDLSDGRWEIYLEQKAVFDPIIEIPHENRVELDTEAPLDATAAEVERFLRASLEHRS